jgi:glycosyltransferase involved in cell wall biosynthesis
MRVLLTNDFYPPDVVGGGELLTHRLAKGLIEKGFSVKVLTTGNPDVKSYDGVKTVRIPVNRHLMNILSPSIAYHAKDADVIHTSIGGVTFPSWLASKLTGKPVCCYVHHIFGRYWRDVMGPAGLFAEQTEKFVLNRSYDAIVFQNNPSKKIGAEIGIDKKRMHLVQPGIDYKRFAMKGLKKEPFVLFVGNFKMDRVMVRAKGLEYLLQAAELLPDVKFVVVGDGEYLNELKKNSPTNVEYAGGLTGKPLIKLYNWATIFCMTSLNEGFGITTLEAMAAGCAVVSTVDIGQSGIKIKPKDATDIKNAVEYLMNRPALARKYGRENQRKAKQFTWDRFIEGIVNIYELITK